MALTDSHPDFSRIERRVKYVMDHYTGDVADALDVYARPSGTGTSTPAQSIAYLPRHEQGESDTAYGERVKITEYTPHFAFAVDSLAGQLFAKEAEAERTWGPVTEDGKPTGRGLGDPMDPTTIAGRLWRDADGQGTDYPTLWKTLPARLIACNHWWILVDGVKWATYGGARQKVREARVVLIDPRSVIDWIEEDGELVEVLTCETVETRRSVREQSAPVKEYVLYDVNGWTRYRDAEKDDPVAIEEGRYAYFADSTKTRRVLPIRRIALPMRRDLGYTMARLDNSLLNLGSTRDFRLWTACVNTVKIKTTKDADQIKKDRAAGGNVWNVEPDGDVEYIHPSQEPALASSEILTQKTEAFYHTFFRSYANEAAQKTATEVMQDTASGVEAFLVLLKTAVDEAENFALARLEQVYFPDQPAMWGHARVTRAESFQPVDTAAKAEALVRLLLEDKVPAGENAIVAAVTRLLDANNIENKVDDVRAAVKDYLDTTDPAALAAQADRLLQKAQTRKGATGDGQNGVVPQLTMNANQN